MLTNATNLSSFKNLTSAESGNYSRIGSGDIAVGTLLALVIFISIVGNLLVCVAIFTDRHLKKIGNFFLVSLAIADLLMSLLVMTFALTNDIMKEWIFGKQFCSVWISLDIMCSTASILNLCAISLDRYIHIKDPLHYETWMSRKRAAVIIATVWVCSTLISFLPIHVGWHTPGEAERKVIQRHENTCHFDINPIYAVISSTISFYVPCIVMLLIYCHLYKYARKHVKNIRRTYSCERDEGLLSDHKAAITLGIIMGVFLFCWAPFFIINLIDAVCKTCIPPLVFQILTWLGYANSSLNPIIYSIFNSEFRDAFRRIIFPKTCTTEQNYIVSAPSKDKDVSTKKSLINGNRKDSKTRLIMEQITTL